MNIQHLRQSVKAQWLDYYRENRDWLSRLGVWVTCEGKRRPSSGFILATLTTLEPQLTQLLPLIVDLTGNPDRIIIALGLNFNPDDELRDIARAEEKAATNGKTKMLPAKPSFVEVVVARPPKPLPKPEPVAAREPQPPIQQSIQPAIPPQPEIQSPFVAPATPFEADEPAAIDPKASAPATPASANTAAPKPSITQPIVRPAMDTEDLAAEELPKRDAKRATAPKQTVRSNR